MNQLKRLGIVLSILIGVVLLFTLYLSWPLLTGTTVILDTLPIDPFDPLRGQYVVINYEISTLPSIADTNVGQTVFVSLAPNDEGIWEAQKASLTKPSNIFIRGTTKRYSGNEMTIEYGIEQFFFERNADLPTENITVEAKVSSSGQARIVQLLHKGEPIEIEYKKPSLTS